MGRTVRRTPRLLRAGSVSVVALSIGAAAGALARSPSPAGAATSTAASVGQSSSRTTTSPGSQTPSGPETPGPQTTPDPTTPAQATPDPTIPAHTTPGQQTTPDPTTPDPTTPGPRTTPAQTTPAQTTPAQTTPGRQATPGAQTTKRTGTTGAPAPPSSGGAPVGAPTAQPGTLPPAASPVAGKSVTLRTSRGLVEVRLPHSSSFLPLSASAAVPLGAVVDATSGAVTLTSASTSGGATKTGQFTGGTFQVTQTQGPRPLTQLRLVGGSFAVCRAGIFHGTRGITFARRRHHVVVRQLWGSDNGGRFQTIGRNAIGTVRGTRWLTQDRCDGTLVRVLKGAVLVHDGTRHRTVLVRAGHAYLAPSRG